MKVSQGTGSITSIQLILQIHLNYDYVIAQRRRVFPSLLPNRMLKNSLFTWFDKLTTGFDKHVLSEAEGLRANGAGVENIADFSFM